MHVAPNLKNERKVIGYPFDVLIPAVTRLAPAPTNVPFPPKQAPKASVQARSQMSKSRDDTPTQSKRKVSFAARI